jgi:hypothetical protein
MHTYIHTQNGMLHNSTDTCYDTDKPQMHYARELSPRHKSNNVRFQSHDASSTVKLTEALNGMANSQGGGQRTGIRCSVRVELQFCMVKNFWRLSTQQCEYT